jgi:CcmD family protein
MSTRFSNKFRRTLIVARPTLPLILGLVVMAVMTGTMYAASGIGDEFVSSAPLAQESGSDPEANLPFLFAVYFITWAGFFGYVFYMSRRQREMRRDIDALKQAVREKEEAAS